MSRCRVVQGEPVRIPLSDGDWIEVKGTLNAGEYYDWIASMAERQPFAKIVAYVLAWSFPGLDGKPLPYSVDLAEAERRATLRALDRGTIREIIKALDKHEAAEDAAVDAKKKAQAIAPASSQTSPSPAPCT